MIRLSAPGRLEILSGLALAMASGPAASQGPIDESRVGYESEDDGYFFEILAPADDGPGGATVDGLAGEGLDLVIDPLIARAGMTERLAQFKSVINVGGILPRTEQLEVCLVSGSVPDFLALEAHARQWEADSTWFRFSFRDSAGNARRCRGDRSEPIRISFGPGGSWSRIGTIDARLSLQTMNIDLATIGKSSNFPWVVRHEFGHALGLRHEHQNPSSSCDDEIDWDFRAPEVLRARFGVDPGTIRSQFRRLVAFGHDFSAYDPLSVMNYPLPREIFKAPPGGGEPASQCINPRRTDISRDDLLGVAEYYSRNTAVAQAAAQRAFHDLQREIENSPLTDYDKSALIALLAVSYPGLETSERARLLEFRQKYTDYLSAIKHP
jgi:hypothetical protein